VGGFVLEPHPYSRKEHLKKVREQLIRDAIIKSGLHVKGAIGNQSYKAIHNYKSIEEVRQKVGAKIDKTRELQELRDEKQRATKTRR